MTVLPNPDLVRPPAGLITRFIHGRQGGSVVRMLTNPDQTSWYIIAPEFNGKALIISDKAEAYRTFGRIAGANVVPL